MSGFIKGTDRNQATLFPERLDDYLAEESAVRVIDVFVDELDLGLLGERERPLCGKFRAFRICLLTRFFTAKTGHLQWPARRSQSIRRFVFVGEQYRAVRTKLENQVISRVAANVVRQSVPYLNVSYSFGTAIHDLVANLGAGLETDTVSSSQLILIVTKQRQLLTVGHCCP